jgi:hypothetical protein
MYTTMSISGRSIRSELTQTIPNYLSRLYRNQNASRIFHKAIFLLLISVRINYDGHELFTLTYITFSARYISHILESWSRQIIQLLNHLLAHVWTMDYIFAVVNQTPISEIQMRSHGSFDYLILKIMLSHPKLRHCWSSTNCYWRHFHISND